MRQAESIRTRQNDWTKMRRSMSTGGGTISTSHHSNHAQPGDSMDVTFPVRSFGNTKELVPRTTFDKGDNAPKKKPDHAVFGPG